MHLTRFSLKNPVAVTLFYLGVALVGCVGFLRMGRSVLPPVSIPRVTIEAPYPGAGPHEIERLVIEPIGEAIRALPGIARVSASAQSGVGTIVVEFRFGTSLDVDRENVRQAVDAARATMPPDLVPPVVSNDDPSQAPILEEGMSSAVLSPGRLSDILAQNVVPALRTTSGVGSVRTAGAVTRQFTVRPDIAALDALRGTPLDVLRAVSGGNDVFPGGVLRSPLQEATIGISDAALSVRSLGVLPLAIPGDPEIRIRDAARVTYGYADRSVVTRVDGRPAIIVLVAHAPGQDALRAIAAAERTFERLAVRFPLVRFERLRTDAPYTRAATAGVLQTLGEGVFLTIVVMLAFLHAWRQALIAAVAIPSSLCATFAAMWALGFSIDVLSLMALSLTIGVLVDDSIVIIEAITRAAARGRSGDDAALAGRAELGGAAFAITLVDVAVFMPIAMMSGIVGEFMREFGLAIVFATGFSLLVSFTLTPLLSARWSLMRREAGFEGRSFTEVLAALRARAPQFPWTFRTTFALRALARWHAAINGFHAWIAAIGRLYATRWLASATHHRGIVVSAAAVACALSFVPVAMGWIPTEFSPPTGRGTVAVDLTLPAGTPLATTDAAARSFTDALVNDDAIAHVTTTAGRAFNGTADVFASNVATLEIVLADPSSDGRGIVARVKALQRLAPSATIAGSGKGMGGAAPIAYSIGGDARALDVAAARISAALRANPYATDVRASNAGTAPRVDVTVDPERTRLLDVSADDAAQTARIATGGSIAAKARLPIGLIDVVVRGDAAESGDVHALRRTPVRSSDGTLVPLGDVTTIRRTREPAIIERENGSRVVSVTANPVDGAPIGMVTAPMATLLRDPNFMPPGTYVEPRGDVEQFLDTVSKMFAALGLSLLMVYAILAVLYRSYTLPLVTMTTVPLASIGAFGTLFALNALARVFPGAAALQGQTLNLYSMLGIVMLVGLVAKNGILLVDFAERARRRGVSARDAMIQAAQRRFRPILMTTLAMIAGMLPLAVGETVGAEYRKALGTVVVGGLSSSLLLTLFLVPVAYLAFAERRTVLTKINPARNIDVCRFNGAASPQPSPTPTSRQRQPF